MTTVATSDTARAAQPTVLVLAMAMANQFWIANALLLGGIAGSIVSAVAKITAYRGSFRRW